jgi:hypothetical protein
MNEIKINETNEVKKISDILILPNLTDIHLFETSIKNAQDSKKIAVIRTRIAGKISKEQQIEI